MSETTHDDGPVIVDTTVAVQPASTAEETTATQDTDTGTASDTDTEQPKTEDAPKKRPWWEQRIAASAFETREAKREAEAARAELARYRQGDTRPPAQSQPPPGMLPAAEVETRAAAMLAETRFADACNAAYDTGVSKYRDFDDAVNTFRLMGGPPPVFLQAVAELGPEAGAKVYYDLGKDPDKASAVFGMPPVKMAMELARMAAAAPRIPAVSKAPAPIEPITSTRTRANAEPDGKDPVEWSRWFRQQRASRSQ